MKILIIEADDRRNLYLDVSKNLAKDGHEVYYFIYQNNIYDEVKTHVHKILTPDDYVNVQIEVNGELKLKKFKIALQSLLDRIYCLELDIDTTELIEKVERSYLIIKKILIDFDIQVLLGDGEAEPFIICGYEICKELNIKNYSFNQISLLPGKSLLLPSGLLDSTELFKTEVNNLNYSKAGDFDAELTINEILNGRVENISYFKHANWFYKKKNIILSFIELIFRVIQVRLYEIKEMLWPTKNKDFFLGSRKIMGIRGVIYRLKRNIKCSIINIYIHFRKFHKLDKNKTILLGIQYRPEASTSVMGTKFCSFEYLLSQVSKNFPGYTIVVKDHPLAFGYLRMKTYFKIILSRDILIYDSSSMCEDDFKFCVVNTSNLGFHMLLKGKNNIIVMGEPIYKEIIDNKINIDRFLSIYKNYCLDDNSDLSYKISKYIVCKN